jgi:hypothetical protein
MSKRKFPVFLLSVNLLYSVFHILFPPIVNAVCPVCTVAVGAGLGVSRALGIDDAVTSVWIGGLILSSSFWLIDWLKKKKPEFPISKFRYLTIVLMYLLFIVPLWLGKYIGRPYNSIFGIDKILFGTFWGSLTFMAGVWADRKIRQVKGKQLFIYQRVVFPVSALVLTSIILHFVVGK